MDTNGAVITSATAMWLAVEQTEAQHIKSIQNKFDVERRALHVKEKRQTQKLKQSKTSTVKKVHRMEYRLAQARMSALKHKLAVEHERQSTRSAVEGAHEILYLEMSTGPVRF